MISVDDRVAPRAQEEHHRDGREEDPLDEGLQDAHQLLLCEGGLAVEEFEVDVGVLRLDRRKCGEDGVRSGHFTGARGFLHVQADRRFCVDV
jgi:hypothetical protein